MPVNRPHCIYPPTDCSVTLPEVVDFHRTHNPYETAYVFSKDCALNPTNISFLEFGRATDRVAHYVRPGRSGRDREVVALIALSDTLLYQAITVGITRAGYIVRGIHLSVEPYLAFTKLYSALPHVSPEYCWGCHRIVEGYVLPPATHDPPYIQQSYRPSQKGTRFH